MRLGIDLDTVLVDYDRPLAVAAAERGLLPTGFAGTRRDLSRLVVALPGGGAEWRRLMAVAQGRLMGLAELAGGAAAVLCACRDRGIDVVLVSLRPAVAAFDPDRTDLWAAATAWLARHGAFRADGFAIPHGNLVFVASRRGRLDAIVGCGCTHFIDADDDDTRDPFFVPGVQRLLLGAAGWDGVAAALFP